MTTTHTARVVRAFLLGLALLLVAALPAIAHAEFVSSDPADKAVIPSPFDGPIELTYDEPLFPGSRADLKGPDGSTVATARIEAEKLVLTLDSALDPGDYTVQWTSVGVDRDIDRGTLTFTVEAPTPTAGASPSPIAPPAPTASPTPSGDGGNPTGVTGDVLLPLLAAVIAVGAIWAFLLRNRRTAGR